MYHDVPFALPNFIFHEHLNKLEEILHYLLDAGLYTFYAMEINYQN